MLCLPVEANIVLNGGFDDAGGSLLHWDYDYFRVRTKKGKIGGPEAGTHFAIETNDRRPSYLMQTISTVPGQEYNLSFYTARTNMRNNNFALDVDIFDSLGSIDQFTPGDLLDTTISDSEVTLDPEWSSFVYSFTARSIQSTLRFYESTTSVDPAIDTVSVTAVPEPRVYQLWLAILVLWRIWYAKNKPAAV